MQPGYRTLGCAAAFAALVLFVTISRGSAQFRCYTTPSSAGELNCGATDGEFEAASIEECCLSENGQFFEARAGTEGCIACIVFGWFEGENFIRTELTDTYTLQAGFIKGGAVQTFVTSSTLARFEIVIGSRSATEGVNEDFIVPDTSHILFGQNPSPFLVPVTLRLDSIALEPDEDFTLSLAPENMNPTATMILAGGTVGMFTTPLITVVIQDLEAAILRFTEIDYSNVEGRNFIQPKLQLSTTIAVDLVIEVIPLNLNVARDLGQLPISLDPIRTDPNFDPDTQTATSVDDFSITPVRVTFASGRNQQTISFNIEITDDTIHEADQVFVLRLEVISGADRNRLFSDRTDGLTSLGRILDDDNIPIGFVQETYTVFEEFNATGDLIPIEIIKGNNLESELLFDVIAQFRDGTATRQEGTMLADYSVASRVTIPFPAASSFITVSYVLLQDDLPEPTEQFTIELTSSGAPRVDIGQAGGPFACATIFIIDSDEALDLVFINNTPRVDGSGILHAQFATNRPEADILLTCHLIGPSVSITQDCANGNIKFTDLVVGDFTLRVIATDIVSGERAVIRSGVWIHGDNEFCTVYAINRRVTVLGNSTTVEFSSTGAPTSFRCRLVRQPFFTCSSPVVLTDLDTGVHRLKIRPIGCGQAGEGHRSLTVNFFV